MTIIPCSPQGKGMVISSPRTSSTRTVSSSNRSSSSAVIGRVRVDMGGPPSGVGQTAERAASVGVGEGVDLGSGALLGHGDEDGVGQVGIPAAQGDAAVEAEAADLGEHGDRVLVAADDELLEEGAVEGRAEAGDRASRSAA